MSLDQSNPNRVMLRTLPAILACFKAHPRALRELRASREVAQELLEVATWMGAEGLPATVVSSREVRELAGVDALACAVTARPTLGLVKLSDFADWRDEGDTVVVADNFTDATDLASVVRAMAAFGSRRLLLSGTSERLAFEPDLWDGARGALEAVRLVRAPALGGLLKLIEETTVVIGFSKGLGRSLAAAAPIRAPGRGNLVVLSPEGVDAVLQPKVEHLVRLPAGKGDYPLSTGDSAALILHWLASAGPDRPKPGTGFMARKRAKKGG